MNKEEIEKIRESLDDYNDLIDYDYGHKDMDLLFDMITNITNVLEKLDKSNNKIEKIKEYIAYLDQLEKTNESEFLKDSYMIVPSLLSIIDGSDE